MHRILAATDLSEHGAWALERAARIAAATKATLVVLHAMDPDTPPRVAAALHAEARKMLVDQLAAHPNGTGAELQVLAGHPVETVIAASASPPADLVVIGRHRRHVLLDLFRGSTGERVLRLGSTPVLVVSRPPGFDYLRMLVGLDFSIPSRLALELAARTFPTADIHVLHAWEMPSSGGLLPATAVDAADAFRRSVEQQIAEFLAGLPAWIPPVRSSTRQCSPTVALRDAVASLPADLLVLGTHGRTGVVRAFLGSVTEDLLKDSPCDILAVQGW